MGGLLTDYASNTEPIEKLSFVDLRTPGPVVTELLLSLPTPHCRPAGRNTEMVEAVDASKSWEGPPVAVCPLVALSLFIGAHRIPYIQLLLQGVDFLVY